METPIFDFVSRYINNGCQRLHMPGHKGNEFLGCEQRDITEITGADYLYKADGIIKESENNASSIFGTAHTFYSTEGSSQCIRAMCFLAVLEWKSRNSGSSHRPVIMAARNVHKTFVLAAAMVDFDIIWLWQKDGFSLCSCKITPEQLDYELSNTAVLPAAVYITSPDYLGNTADIKALAEISHRRGVPLIVDNAHGAYLKFCENELHPIEAGADMCCDSAHKTLPVLTGGAYIHISHLAPSFYLNNCRRTLEMFGSTSPSFLTLQSLDLCNRYIENGYADKLASCCNKIEQLKTSLKNSGWSIAESDPLRITIEAKKSGYTGTGLGKIFEDNNCFCEFFDPDYLVIMLTPENPEKDFAMIKNVLNNIEKMPPLPQPDLSLEPPEKAMSVRQAVFLPHETIEINKSLGRVLALTGVSCPPAVPVAVSGEIINKSAIEVFKYFGINNIDVIA